MFLGIKKKPTTPRRSSTSTRSRYTLSLEGDAFQLLDFMNMIESHKRFMRVPTFRIQAAQRTQMEKEGVIAHRIQLDVETFVYEPKKDQKTVKIDGYDRKRDLLLGEIQRRRQDLALMPFSYRGQRGRRDPWIDPRVPVQRVTGPAEHRSRSRWTSSRSWPSACRKSLRSGP